MKTRIISILLLSAASRPLAWHEIKTARWSFTWKLKWMGLHWRFVRNVYGFSLATPIGNALFTRFVAILLLSALAGCTTTQVASTVSALANTAATAYSDYVKAQAGALTPQDVITASTLAYNDISGVAAMAQAYVGSGKTPSQAAIETGASAAPVAAQVVAALPNVPIDQITANNLYAAATQAANQILATQPAAGPVGRVGIYGRDSK